jgi:hypothetical protein
LNEISKARARAEGELASSLLNPVSPEPGAFLPPSRELNTEIRLPGTGFSADDGASLLVTFRGLQSESVAQGQVHKSIAQELRKLVVDPFDQWSQGHKVCAVPNSLYSLLNALFQQRVIERKRAFFDVYIPSYEQAQGEVRNRIDITTAHNLPGTSSRFPHSSSNICHKRAVPTKLKTSNFKSHFRFVSD